MLLGANTSVIHCGDVITATSNGNENIRLHLPLNCLFTSLRSLTSNEISNLCITGRLCEGNPPVDSLHKRPVMRKVPLFHDVIMVACDCFLATTKQLYEWFSLSVRPSVCLSVCLSVTPFWLCSHHRIITKFSGAIANGRSDALAKGQGHSSKVKVTEVITQLSRFRTVTPVWIHIWWRNDA